MTKTPLTALIIIIFNILMGTSNGEVFINELSVFLGGMKIINHLQEIGQVGG